MSQSLFPLADRSAPHDARLRVDGKFLTRRAQRLLLKGVTYGTFAPDAAALQFPPLARVSADFGAMARAGINTVRVYTPPTRDIADAAADAGLVLMVGIPWTQHVAFLDDRPLARTVRRDIVSAVRALADHPAVGIFALGNEIPASIVRWHGAGRVSAFLRSLYEAAKPVAGGALLTYVNFPPTDFLDLECFDFCAFNVYLHREADLRAYFTRLQLLAGPKPLLLAEAGADSIREGLDGQAAITAMHLRTTFELGAAGAIAFAWTDEWWRGGETVSDWAFGLVDDQRRPKPALAAVSHTFNTAPFSPQVRARWPKVSVVVCAYNAADTLVECLESLGRLTYPDCEILLVNDGSRDGTGELARRFPFVRVIDIPNGGLSAARNVGWMEARGEIVAYTDADVRVDPDWLTYLVQPLLEPEVVGSGGPNVVPPDDAWTAQAVARAPGGPTHVLLDDRIAEHVPGCNMAFRRSALEAIGGFNPIFLRAGDDVDVCWRLQARGWKIGFAPSALVWHRHRASVGAYWRQQVGYGEGEAWLKHQHPDRFVGAHMLWHGRIYSPLPFVNALSSRRVNTGVWGLSPFPSVYYTGAAPLSYLPHEPTWQLISAVLLVTGAVTAVLSPWPAAASVLLAIGALGLAMTAARCMRHALASDIEGVRPRPGLSAGASRIALRALIAWLHLLQPLARIRGRIRGLLTPPQLPEGIPEVPDALARPVPRPRDLWAGLQLLTGGASEQRFWSERWLGADAVIRRVLHALRRARVSRRIDIDDGWTGGRDLAVALGRWAWIDLQALVEEHAQGRVLVRWRSAIRPTAVTVAVAIIALLAITLASSDAAADADPRRAAVILAGGLGALLIILWRTAAAYAGVSGVVRHATEALGARHIGRSRARHNPTEGFARARRVAGPAFALATVAMVAGGSASLIRDALRALRSSTPAVVSHAVEPRPAIVRFRPPRLALAVAPNGDLYLADGDHDIIRRVSGRGALLAAQLLATPAASPHHEMRSPEAPLPFDTPGGVAVAPNGDLYVVDAHNHRVCRIDRLTRATTVVAGNGRPGFAGDGGSAALALLSMPSAVVVAPNGDLFIADTGNHRVRRIQARSHTITTVAGHGTTGDGTDVGDGLLATEARLAWPADLALAPNGDLYIADTAHDRVRRVDARTGVVTTVAGNGRTGAQGDGGPATTASLSAPTGLAIAARGRRLTLYIADSANGRIRVVTPDGRIDSLKDPDMARLRTPTRLAVHPKGWLYVADGTSDQVQALSLAEPRPRPSRPARHAPQPRVM